jgi:uncharacterized protein (DUF433 family)
LKWGAFVLYPFEAQEVECIKLRKGPMVYKRITVNPKQMGGVPCLRGLRIPVASVVDMVADRMTIEEILEAFPDLEEADITESLRYAAEAVRERELPLLGVA